ncbi:MAG: prepilin-type N-terminal cleavage/methylation domain-containing protein [Capsulimonas sp.]|uniref:type II secretion system protein n=1 Tax=Capsulimonas sp. TaxID=2494211 RepID=UPI003264C363
MKRGFTLIELLIVIAIISILAAILFPVFAQARKRAQNTACLSNLRQIGMATQMYVQENDETFFWNLGDPANPSATIKRFSPSVYDDTIPPADASQSNRWDPSPIMPVLEPYVKNAGIWVCPGTALPYTGINGIQENTSRDKTSYQVNPYIAVNDTLGPPPHSGPVTLADVVNPTGVKVFQDYYNKKKGQVEVVGVHFGGGNYVCVDGHTKFQRGGAANAGAIFAKWWQES